MTLTDEQKLGDAERTLKRAALEYAHMRMPAPPRQTLVDFYLAVMIEVEVQLMEVRHTLIEGNAALRALDVIDYAKMNRIPNHLDLTPQLEHAHHELVRSNGSISVAGVEP